jgi:hypothetical protein
MRPAPYQGSYPEARPLAPADPEVMSASALHAVQVALDRRDNGGDAGAHE